MAWYKLCNKQTKVSQLLLQPTDLHRRVEVHVLWNLNTKMFLRLKLGSLHTCLLVYSNTNWAFTTEDTILYLGLVSDGRYANKSSWVWYQTWDTSICISNTLPVHYQEQCCLKKLIYLCALILEPHIMDQEFCDTTVALTYVNHKRWLDRALF